MCNIKFYDDPKSCSWIKSVDKSETACGYIEGLDLDKIAYVTQASEAAFAILSERNKVKMEILRENHEHCDPSLLVALSFKDKDKLLQTKGNKLHNIPVAFQIKQSYFNSLIRSVNLIEPEIIERILPTRHNFLPDQPVALSDRANGLDSDHCQALHVILSSNSKSPPVIISGPFGTGKTRLIATATCCLLEQEQSLVRILICAHHYGTLDDLIQQLEKFTHVPFELIKLVPKGRNRRKYGKYDKLPLEVSDTCSRLNRRSIVVVTTFTTSLSITNAVGNKFFTHILMDEGSQTREPEAIAPLSLASINTKIVIAGDKQQVSIKMLFCCLEMFWKVCQNCSIYELYF